MSSPAPVAARLLELWTDLLRVPELAPESDFFGVGGDSYRATQLASLVSGEFGVEVPVTFAFAAPRLAEQARWIEDALSGGAEPEAAAGAPPPAGEVPLSALQGYFLRWMHETPEPRRVSAITVAMRVREELDPAALAWAVSELMARHEALRTVFPPAPDGHRALVLPAAAPDVVALAATGATAGDRESDAGRLAAAAVDRAFDVAAGPLVRLVTVAIDLADHVVVLAVHHLAVDGWSMGILVRELGVLYAAARSGRPSPLPPPGLRSAELVAWQREHWPATRPYWLDALRGAPPALAGAPGRRPAERYAAASLPLLLPGEAARSLRAVGTAQGATMFMVLAAAWSAVLAAWARSPEVVLMSPVRGRTRPEHESVVGCLLQSLLIRVRVAGAASFGELVARARAAVVDATAHQFSPFEELSRLVPHPAWLRFETWRQSSGDALPERHPRLEFEPFRLPPELQFEWPMPPGEPDLSVPELRVIEQSDDSIVGWLVYNRHAFEPDVVEALGRQLVDRCRDVFETAPWPPSR